jgi:hypothetical protein
MAPTKSAKKKEELITSLPGVLDTENLVGNFCVRTPILRIDRGVGKPIKSRKHARKYSPTTMRNGINKYFGWCEKNDRVPSLKGLMIYLKMCRDQFYVYAEYPEFTMIMEQARQVILEWCENDVYRTTGPAAGKIAYMKNIHDWTEKIDQTQNITTKKILSVDEAHAKIASLAPLLLQVLQGTTLAQIGNTKKVEVIEGEVQ